MLELTLRPTDDRTPIEAECLTPDRLIGLSAAEVGRLAVQHGNRPAVVADFFDVRSDARDGEIRLRGDCSAVKWIGARMTRGRLVVDGDVGMHLGAEMAGGEIEIRGDAGPWAGAEMRGGLIRILGDAGDAVGSAYPGSKIGMTGGVVLVHGDVGEEVGRSMRRGLITVGGSAGDFVGANLIAGSIFVFGRCGRRPGAGMRRGSIVLFGSPDRDPALLPTFRYACDFSPGFLPLYLQRMREWGFPLRRQYAREGLFRRFHGDMVAHGKGEILAWREA